MEKVRKTKQTADGTRRAHGFLAWMDEMVVRHQQQGRPGTASSYRNTRRSLAAFLDSTRHQEISLRKVDARLLSDYQTHLLRGGCCRNTVACHLRNLRAAYNEALREGLTALSRTGHPFENMLTKPVPTRKRAVPSDLIRRLRSLDIRAALVRSGRDPGRKTFSKTLSDLEFARDTFIFSFFACGLPFVDFAYLRPANLQGDRLCYERHKTGRYIEMELLPEMRVILRRHAVAGGHYLFPVISSPSPLEAYRQYIRALRKYNHKLRMLSALLGDGVQLTTYVVRHSWATTVYHHNMPVAYISERMGHTSEKTTRTYLKSFERSQIDEAHKRILRSIFT